MKRAGCCAALWFFALYDGTEVTNSFVAVEALWVFSNNGFMLSIAGEPGESMCYKCVCVLLFVSFLPLASCGGGSDVAGVAPISEEERAVALQYVNDVPFVFGTLPFAYEGSVDPLVRFAAHPNYAGHMVVMNGSVFSEQGIDVGSTDVEGLVVLFKQGTNSDALVAAATEDGCGSSASCRSDVRVVAVPYSLVELRSVTGWIARSPLRFTSTQTLISEDGDSYGARARFTVDESRLEILKEMLTQSGAPTDAYEVALNNYLPATN